MDGPLTPAEKKRIIDLYEDRLSRFGSDYRTAGWGSRETQLLRFEVLCRGLDLSGKRVLDVGCGLGDLVPFLVGTGIADFHYTCVDISSGLIAEANRLHGGKDRVFIAGDLLDGLDPGRFDVIFCSGALTLRIADNIAFAEAMLRKMYALSDGVVAANFLSTYVDYQAEKDFHYEPEAIFSMARKLAQRVNLFHDYPLYEFTIQIFRN